jgi:hypothetical protein
MKNSGIGLEMRPLAGHRHLTLRLNTSAIPLNMKDLAALGCPMTKNKNNVDESRDVAYRLRTVANKLQGLGHLIAQDHSIDSVPLNLPEIREGIGAIVDDLAKDVREVSNQIDLREP